jgi:diketogulonate reductase-like aldo/keto reductase
MNRRHQTGQLTRRQALALAGGLAMSPIGAAAQAVAPGPTAPIMTRPIPSSGGRLPVVGLGTAYQWYSEDQRATLGAVVRALVAGGGSVVDTAGNGGGYGIAETMLGEVIGESGLRPRLFLASKIEEHFPQSPASVQGAAHLLQTNKVDLIQVHSVDSADQSLAALRDWKAQGLARYIGITTAITRYFDVVEAIMQREKPDFIQIDYWIEARRAERRLLPLAASLGIAVMINMPFGGVEGQDQGLGRNLFSLVKGKPLPDWAREFDAASWGQFFLKYLLGNPAVTVVIPGTSKPEHMADNLGAARGRLPDAVQRQQMAQFIDALA